MIHGHVRDNFPRVLLSLPGHQGYINIEFVLNTGFEGELSIPSTLISDLNTNFVTNRDILLADGSVRLTPLYEILLDWNDDIRSTEIIVLEGRPLLGTLLLEGSHLQIDMNNGGEVVIDFN